ncbi:polyketide cyclase / dehydrase and lipid transport [Rhodococcus artemisiae]|uniref:Polyketide cyclase / dehydrase and lipid transport n=1 Tax=Rhodococcus artemisiae TaxID=714159 RepID=A0ABU7LE88_9NOCA|nr:polyketide cyclase / dehydrase and lipid transport [Rhodococcus artemisiae]MEE2059830.1 polyketide cyclase / dehydrase and lipid transport [Rhodococcus artemisiae]
MSSIQVSDQTFIAADPARISAEIAAPDRWRVWWPDLALTVREDRAEQGIRWAVSGSLTGTMEVWLEPSLDGAIIHYFLHCEPTGVAPDRVAELDLAAMNRERRVAGKKMTFEVKARLEAGRPAGESPRDRS